VLDRLGDPSRTAQIVEPRVHQDSVDRVHLSANVHADRQTGGRV
jgi:hypothetical protein